MKTMDKAVSGNKRKIVSEAKAKEMIKANQLGYARQLYFWRVSEFPQVKVVVKFLYDEFVRATGFNRKGSSYRQHIKILILDTYVAYTQDREQFIFYSRNRNDYNTKSRYKFMSYRMTLNASQFLIDTGYLEFHKGFRYSHNAKMSRIRATPKLMDLFEKAEVDLKMVKRDPNEPVIRLKDNDNGLQEFEDTPETIKMETELKEFNRVYETHSIHHNLTPDEEKELREYLKQENKTFDDSTIRLRRTFLRGDFKHGGRLAGGWWQSWPEDYRSKITVNGKKVVELDYTSLHPTILYHALKKAVPEHGLYYLDGYENDEVCRKFLKMVLLILINAKTEGEAIKAIRLKLNTKKLKAPCGVSGSKTDTIKTVINDIRLQHSTISPFFCTDTGVALQRKESDINIGILRRFKDKELPLPLPEYDSFITTVDQETALRRAMVESYKEVMGQKFEIGIDKKY